MNPAASTIPRIKYGKNELDKKLLQPYRYTSQVQGTNVRAIVLDVFNYWLETPEHIIEEIYEIVTMSVNAGLMIDDIQDESNARRGVPSAHIIYGIPATLNAAYYMLFTAFQKANYLTSRLMFVKMCVRVTVWIGSSYWRGLEDREWKFISARTLHALQKRNTVEWLSETGSFFALGIKLEQAFSKKKYDFTKLTSLIGLHRQINDDYVNLVSPEYHEYKGFCEDITEGKFSYPIVHAINSDPNKILKMRTTDVELKKRCLSLIEKCGSLEYTKNKLNHLHEEILKEVEKLGGHPTFKKYFEKNYYL